MIRLTHEDVQRRLDEISTQIEALYSEQEYLIGIQEAFKKVQEECVKYERHLDKNRETHETEVDHISAFTAQNSIIEYLDVRQCVKDRIFKLTSIRTMNDLINATDEQILGIYGIGRKTLNEIRYAQEELIAKIREGWSGQGFGDPEQEYLYRERLQKGIKDVMESIIPSKTPFSFDGPIVENSPYEWITEGIQHDTH